MQSGLMLVKVASDCKHL